MHRSVEVQNESAVGSACCVPVTSEAMHVALPVLRQ